MDKLSRRHGRAPWGKELGLGEHLPVPLSPCTVPPSFRSQQRPKFSEDPATEYLGGGLEASRIPRFLPLLLCTCSSLCCFYLPCPFSLTFQACHLEAQLFQAAFPEY